MNKVNFKWLGVVAILVAAVLWGLDGYIRTILYSLPPLTIIFAEHAIGTVIAVPLLIAFRKKLKPLSKNQKIAITVVALLSGVGGTLLFTAALQQTQYIPFSVVFLLQQLEPFFAIAGAAIFLKEKLNKRFVVLAIAAIIGGYMVSFPNLTVNFATGAGTAIAALMAIGAAAAWGSSTAISKYALKDTYWLQITGIRFGLATLLSGLALLIFPAANAVNQINSQQFNLLVGIAFSTGFVALAFYYFGLQRVRASRTTILELAFPLTAVIAGFLFFDQQALTATQWLGAAILTFASFQISRQEAEDKA